MPFDVNITDCRSVLTGDSEKAHFDILGLLLSWEVFWNHILAIKAAICDWCG